MTTRASKVYESLSRALDVDFSDVDPTQIPTTYFKELYQLDAEGVLAKLASTMKPLWEKADKEILFLEASGFDQEEIGEQIQVHSRSDLNALFAPGAYPSLAVLQNFQINYAQDAQSVFLVRLLFGTNTNNPVAGIYTGTLQNMHILEVLDGLNAAIFALSGYEKVVAEDASKKAVGNWFGAVKAYIRLKEDLVAKGLVAHA